MPGGDRTGPNGLGPMTGRSAGFCTRNTVPGYANHVPGYGFGGGGRGRRNRYCASGLTGLQRGAKFGYPASGTDAEHAPFGTSFHATMTKEQEASMLKGQASYLENSLSEIKKRIEKLETGKKE